MNFVQQKRRVVILLDYENLSIAITSRSLLLDVKELISFCVKNIGTVLASFVFLPVSPNIIDTVREYHGAGFFTVVCPKLQGEPPLKEKDLVDSIMIDFAKRMLDENHEVTDVVILTHDGDFVPLVNFLRARGKIVSLGVFEKEKISRELQRLVGFKSIFEVPTKSP